MNLKTSPGFQETEGNFYSYMWWTFSVTLLQANFGICKQQAPAAPMCDEQEKLTPMFLTAETKRLKTGNALSEDTTKIEYNL